MFAVRNLRYLPTITFRSCPYVLVVLLSIGTWHFYAHGEKHTERPTWATNAVALDLRCASSSLLIKSPDQRSSVEIVCEPRQRDDPTYAMRVQDFAGRSFTVPLDNGAHEILWSPDSKAFFINGGTSAYAGFFVTVYRLNQASGLHREIITNQAQHDMVARFPPCKASNHDDDACRQTAADPQFNMSGIAWTRDSSAIDVFAEIPCSSSYGGIMCQVLGYELSVPSGRILRRFTAPEMKRLWQPMMAWKMTVPDPPRYGPSRQR